jgi:hypothetical protein
MKKFSELTVAELTGCAFAEFGHHRFTASELTTFLCSLLLKRRMTVADLSDTNELIAVALRHDYFVSVPGKRGGPGFAVTEFGVNATSDVALPFEQFEKRLALAKERSTPADANAGPMFEALYRAAPDDEGKTFVYKVYEFWLNNKWLSSKQMDVVAGIAKKCEFPLNQHVYVGAAQDDWVKPYVDSRLAAQRRRNEEGQAAIQAKYDAAQEQRRLRTEAKEENRRVKVFLQELEQSGALGGLEALAKAVFPTASVSAQVKTAAFAGAGSNKLRICVAALAFGKPPSEVWTENGCFHQPGADSEHWQALMAHPAFAPYKGKVQQSQATA